ncbi:AAA family ATPase [Sorangium sp. So ce117]|uniref:AAA family ATPase n=1 Tax=Sorangium sp. So ce117 TaxID=3133277 RepID=UPI003F5F8939
MLAGTQGTWEWTPLGERFWRKHQNELLVAPKEWPSLSDEETGGIGAPLETVEVTSVRAYQIPLLRILSRGPSSKRELMAGLGVELGSSLLPGDTRLAPQGTPVYQYRASWALMALNKDGDVKNVGHGMWQITAAGRSRLERDEATWSIASYRGSQAKVRRLSAGRVDLPEPSPPDDAQERVDDEEESSWHISLWQASRDRLGQRVFADVDSRLRPDLGPSPSALKTPLTRNLIFYGPPGTGKTFVAAEIAKALTGEAQHTDEGRYRMVQLHPSYAYEDFVQGLRPDLERTGLHYRIQPGLLLQICEAAREDPDRFYVLVVDEINRGDPSRVFGEALYAIEYRGRPIGLASGGELVVPPNLVLLGTMNSVDRSVALMDYALRRRFGFIYMQPDLDIVRSRNASAPGIDAIVRAVEQLNEWLRLRIGQEHVLGHSFFLNAAHPLDQRESLAAIWRLDIVPLLEEYLFHDREGLKEVRQHWERWTADIPTTSP